MTKPTPPINRVRIRFLWRLLEIEGEGIASVVGGLVVALLFVGWCSFSNFNSEPEGASSPTGKTVAQVSARFLTHDTGFGRLKSTKIACGQN